jgi:hypothetical protein
VTTLSVSPFQFSVRWHMVVEFHHPSVPARSAEGSAESRECCRCTPGQPRCRALANLPFELRSIWRWAKAKADHLAYLRQSARLLRSLFPPDDGSRVGHLPICSPDRTASLLNRLQSSAPSGDSITDTVSACLFETHIALTSGSPI